MISRRIYPAAAYLVGSATNTGYFTAVNWSTPHYVWDPEPPALDLVATTYEKEDREFRYPGPHWLPDSIKGRRCLPPKRLGGREATHHRYRRKKYEHRRRPVIR